MTNRSRSRGATPPPDRTKTEFFGIWSGDVRYSDRDSRFLIASLKGGYCVKGHAQPEAFDRGERYRFLGRWKDDPKFGPYFEFTTFVQDTPATRGGVLAYLSKTCRGIGLVYAEALWDAFGPDAVRVLRESPSEVSSRGILTEAAAEQAAADLAHHSGTEATRVDLFELFAGRGFPGKLIDECIREWGAKAAAKVRHDPFLLLTREMPGCGFKRCDKLYLDRGGDPGSLKRQMLVAWSSFRDDGTGHTWFERDAARAAIMQHIPSELQRPDKAIEYGVRVGWLRERPDDAGKRWIAPSEYAVAEQTLADNVRRLLSRSAQWPEVQDERLSEHQRDQWASAAVGSLTMLTGSPGTGKTFSSAAVVRAVVEAWGQTQVAVCAPTGKAAVRISEALAGYGVPVAATTIHRLLAIGRNGHDGKGWAFEHTADNPLPYRCVVVDEVSMCDTPLLSALLDACATGTHVLLVGDPHQLPPVGHGAPLRDLIAAGVPRGELSEIRRNAGRIVRACVQIRDGRKVEFSPAIDLEAGENLRLVEADSAEAQAKVILDVLRRWRDTGRYDPVWGCQVIVGVNDKSEVARSVLNTLLQAELNPPPDDRPRGPFRTGDKVICLKNGWYTDHAPCIERPSHPSDYTPKRNEWEEPQKTYVANGELGRVLVADSESAALGFDDRIVVVKWGRRRGGEDDGDEGGGSKLDFDLAYAVTCHKFQGSEVPCAVVVIDPAASRVAKREWVYTAISRASKLCVVVGRRDVFDLQAAGVSLVKRKTFLRELILEGSSHGREEGQRSAG